MNQTTPENLHRDIGSYTVDPATRYPNLNRSSVNTWQVKHLVDADDKSILEQSFMETNALQNTQSDTPVHRKRYIGGKYTVNYNENLWGVVPVFSKVNSLSCIVIDLTIFNTILLNWIRSQLHTYEFTKDLKEVTDILTNGQVLCALINR